MLSLSQLYTIGLTSKMLCGEIGEQLRLQCLQCALLQNSHYEKNIMVLRCKQGGLCLSFTPESWLIWQLKMWYDEKVLAKKKKSLPRREENEDLSFYREIILSILPVRKSPGDPLLLLSLPARRLYRDCQTQEPL